ncbi:MAG: iron-containing alcohol dehydrogenase, partial [Isosphaeraceae bacterium]
MSRSSSQAQVSPDGLVAGTHALFTFPNRVIFGNGARAALAAELNRLRITRPLIVTDAGLVASGLVAEVTASIKSAVVFQGVQGNPTEADVLTGLEQYNSNRCDGLIGLGGGSSVDAAKAIRLLVTHPGRLADYDYTQGGLDRITSNLPPL